MDSLGEDADELGYDEDPQGRSHSFSSAESLAVASLALAACSLFAGGLMQYIAFAFSSPFDTPRGQYLLYITPTALFAALAVALGMAVTRRDGDRWTGGIAGAAVIVGGLVLVIVLIGVVLAFTLEGAEGLDFSAPPS